MKSEITAKVWDANLRRQSDLGGFCFISNKTQLRYTANGLFFNETTLGKSEISQNKTLICWGTTVFACMDMRTCFFLWWGWKCRDTHRIIEGIYTWGFLYVAKHQQLSHHKQSFSFSHLFYYLHKTTLAPWLQTGSMYLLSHWKRNLSDQFPQNIQTYGI